MGRAALWVACLPLAAEKAAAACPPMTQLHGESDLTARARAMLSPGIVLLEANASPADCPVTRAWITSTERGIMLVVESPWGVEARAVQSLELAVALLESWSVHAGHATLNDDGPSGSGTSIVLEPPSHPADSGRRFSIAAHTELTTASGRSAGIGAEVSAGPILGNDLRPFLSLRGGAAFGFPIYAGRDANGAPIALERSARELGLMIGLELELQPLRWLNLDLALCGGFASLSVDQTSVSPSPDAGARSFVDPVAEARVGVGLALSKQWAIELSVRLASMRDLSRVMIPAAEPETLDYDGFLFTTRAGLGLRWTLTADSGDTAAEGESSSNTSRLF